MEYPKLTVDSVVMDMNKGLLLVKRKNDPEKGKWALPGGFVNYNEDPADAAAREVKEETGLSVELMDPMNAKVFGEPGRDARGHIVTLVYMAQPSPSRGELKAGDDAEDARFFSEDEYSKMKNEVAFDHVRIIEEALGW